MGKVSPKDVDKDKYQNPELDLIYYREPMQLAEYQPDVHPHRQ